MLYRDRVKNIEVLYSKFLISRKSFFDLGGSNVQLWKELRIKWSI